MDCANPCFAPNIHIGIIYCLQIWVFNIFSIGGTASTVAVTSNGLMNEMVSTTSSSAEGATASGGPSMAVSYNVHVHVSTV